MSAVYAYLQRLFGLNKNQAITWLVALAIFLAIGLFVRSNAGDFSTYLLAALLFAINCFLLALLKGVDRIRIAILTFLYVLNLILFGYYYFNSLIIFY